MLSKNLREKIETLSADKGYDDIKVIDGLREHGIKAIIDIRNQWQSGESTKQYKNTEIVYTYDGKVGIIDDEGIFNQLKYLREKVLPEKQHFFFYAIPINLPIQYRTPSTHEVKIPYRMTGPAIVKILQPIPKTSRRKPHNDYVCNRILRPDNTDQRAAS